MKPTNTGIPQGLPVSPILFVIYISGVFDQVEQKIGATGLSFVDDIS
jgi:retron-type reverse transcriptase